MSNKCWDFQTIHSALKVVVKSIGHMPSKREFDEMGRGDLSKAIQKHGGYRRWAEIIGVPPNRQRWTEDKIEQSILDNMIDDRMPTDSELAERGLSGLSGAIARYGGYRHWQKKLGIERKNTETHRGQEWEEWALDHLTKQGMIVESMSTQYPFDILVKKTVNGKESWIRVDVKSSSHHEYASKSTKVKGYMFGIQKPKGHTCDIYMMICLSDDKEPLDVYYIPASSSPRSTVTITPKGKYSLFKDNLSVFDLL